MVRDRGDLLSRGPCGVQPRRVEQGKLIGVVVADVEVPPAHTLESMVEGQHLAEVAAADAGLDSDAPLLHEGQVPGDQRDAWVRLQLRGDGRVLSREVSDLAIDVEVEAAHPNSAPVLQPDRQEQRVVLEMHSDGELLRRAARRVHAQQLPALRHAPAIELDVHNIEAR